MFNVIKKVDLEIEEKQFNFSQNEQSIFNATSDEEGLQSIGGFVESNMPFTLGNKTAKIKCLNYDIYFLDNSGYLYKHDGIELKACNYKFSSDFKLGYVDYQGKTVVIAFSQFDSVLLDNGLVYKLPFSGSDYAYAFGRIFYFNNNFIYFTKPYEFFGEPDGVINLEDVAGEFRKLYVIHDDLYVLCSQKLYKIPRFGGVEQLKINVVPLTIKNVVVNAVLGIGDKLYFLQNFDICFFDGKTVQRVPTILPESEYILYSTDYGECYGVINLHVKHRTTNASYIYRYDTNTGKQSLVEFSGTLMPGYSAYISKDGKLMVLNENATAKVAYQSTYTNFSEEKEKLVYCISGYASAPTTIIFEGDFGIKTFLFNRGFNQIYCNFKFTQLKVAVNCFAEGFQLKRLKIKYSTVN